MPLTLPTLAGETQLSVDYGILQMAGACFGVVMWSHWAACAWMLQVTFRDDSALAAVPLEPAPLWLLIDVPSPPVRSLRYCCWLSRSRRHDSGL